MGRVHHPVRGSRGYSPRKRANRIYPRVSVRAPSKEAKVLDFGGYKVGMVQVRLVEDKQGPLKGQELVTPATVLEVHPMKIAGIRAYGKDVYGGLKALTEVWATDLDKHLARKTNIPKKAKDLSSLDSLQNVSKFSLIVYTQPTTAGIHKKKPELFEADIGGSLEEQLTLAKEKLGKEVAITEVFTPGQFVDVIGVTKGYGFQGSVKRWGVNLLKKKSQHTIRKAGNLGPEGLAKVQPAVPQFGQMGFHNRTEYNKRLLTINDNPEEINADGWKRYGVVKNTYILIRGSVQGPVNRFIRMRAALRPNYKNQEVTVSAVMR